MAEGVVGDEPSAQSDGESAGREGAALDRVLQEIKRAAKNFFLRTELAYEERESGMRILRRGQMSHLEGLIGL